MPVPVKRGRGRPKGSGTKKTAATATPTTTTRKSKVQIRIEQVAIDDDQQVSHLSFKEALHNQEPQLTELEQRLHDIDDSWETESLFEDIIEDLSDDTAFKDGKTTHSSQLTFFLFCSYPSLHMSLASRRLATGNYSSSPSLLVSVIYYYRLANA